MQTEEFIITIVENPMEHAQIHVQLYCISTQQYLQKKCSIACNYTEAGDNIKDHL